MVSSLIVRLQWQGGEGLIAYHEVEANPVTYLNCPRCGLSLRAHHDPAPDPACPRCRGQVGLIVPMYETERLRPPVAAPEVEPQAGHPSREPQIV